MGALSRSNRILAAAMVLTAPAYANAASLEQVANFHQSSSSSGSRALYYKNEDVVTSTGVTARSELYTTNGVSTAPSAYSVRFNFLDAPGGFSRSLAGEQNALFTMSALSTTAPQALSGFFFQNFESGTISYKLATPV
jgi:hypothetical protein